MAKLNAALASAVVAALSGIYGCTPEPPPFDPHTLQQYNRQAARGVAARPMAELSATLDTSYMPQRSGVLAPPTTAPTTGPALGEEPTLHLTLQEAVQRAVNNNMDIRVAGYDPAMNADRVVEAEAAFDPTFFTSGSYEHSNRLNGGTLATDFSASPISTSLIPESDTDTYKLASGIKQDLETGGQVQAQYATSRIKTDPAQTQINPYWDNELSLQLTQPLLRNFGAETNTARITIARNDQRISLLDFRGKVEDTLFTIEQTYWQLVAAIGGVQIQEELLRQTVETAQLLAKRGAQDVTRVQTSQANLAVQQRRAQLIRQKTQVRDLSDKLKQLMNDPTLPVSSSVLILPRSTPLQTAIHFDLKEMIDSATEHRFELAQQALRIDTESVRSRVAKNNELPKLDAQGSIISQGLEQNFAGAVDSENQYNHLDYTLGLQFEVPIGNRAARAIYRRTLLGRLAAISQYRLIVDQVSLEVKIAYRNVQTTWDEMVSNRQARLAAADTLDALILREQQSEALTPTFVQLKLDTQSKLADAARSEVEATTNYNLAVAQLERAKGTLLAYDNVMMEEDQTLLRARYRAEVNGAMRDAKGNDVQPPKP
jgi:outer membrane protein